MVIVRYPGEEKPTPSAVRIGESDNWLILNGSEQDNLPDGARLLAANVGRGLLKRSKPLPNNHPLFNEFVLEGPFPAGHMPGDIRMNPDGSTDYHAIDSEGVGNWYPYSDSNGYPVDPAIIE